MKDTEEIQPYQKYSGKVFPIVWEGRPLYFKDWLLLPWEEWIRLARDGDTKATQLFCLAAEPFIRPLCEWRLLTDRLGRDEVRSMAALAVIEFLMTYKGSFRNRKIPFMLWRYVRYDLLDALRRQNTRHCAELPEVVRGRDRTETNLTLADRVDPRPELQPEQVLLQDDFRAEVRDAMNSLDGYEQAVIHSIYFQRKNIGETSRELGLSPQYARRLHRSALERLRGRLEKRLA